MVHDVERERFLTGYSGRLFVVLSFGWLAATLGRSTIPPLLPTIIDHLAITPFQAGMALTLLWVLFSALQYPGGRLSDVLSRKTVLVAGLAAMLVGFGLLTLVSTYPVFLVGVSFVGVGAGAYFIAARAQLTDLFVTRRSQAFGINSAGGTAGSALAAGVAVVALAVATWRTAFLPSIAVLVVVLVAIHVWSRESYVVAPVSLGLQDTGRRVFRDPQVRWLLTAYTLHSLTLQAVAGFLPTFLQVEKEFSPTLASAGFATLWVVGVVAMPLAGTLGDRVTSLPVTGGALGLATLGLVGLLAADSPWLVMVGIVLLAAGLMAYPPVIQAYLMGLFPNTNLGGDFGAFKSVYTGVGSLGPAYVGFVAERASYATAFAGLIVCLVAGVAITLWLMRAW